MAIQIVNQVGDHDHVARTFPTMMRHQKTLLVEWLKNRELHCKKWWLFISFVTLFTFVLWKSQYIKSVFICYNVPQFDCVHDQLLSVRVMVHCVSVCLSPYMHVEMKVYTAKMDGYIWCGNLSCNIVTTTSQTVCRISVSISQVTWYSLCITLSHRGSHVYNPPLYYHTVR